MRVRKLIEVYFIKTSRLSVPNCDGSLKREYSAVGLRLPSLSPYRGETRSASRAPRRVDTEDPGTGHNNDEVEVEGNDNLK
jgi:hypothetical protein